MDWIKSINNALEYIETNLTEEIDYSKLAQAACCSEYHFSRMFSSMAGITLSEYIRRRRLTEAAFELQKTGIHIIDVAVRYNYDSADSFTRAFKKLHGIKPSEAREKGTMLKAYPRMSFQLSIIGVKEMDYRIENLDFELRIAGKKKTVKTRMAARVISELWGEAKENGFLQTLIDMSWEKPQCKMEGILGICGKDSDIRDEEFEYFMGARYQGEVPGDMETLLIPPSSWAVFPNVIDAWKRIYSEWLPASGYQLGNLPCIENFLAPGHQPENELWVPVITGYMEVKG